MKKGQELKDACKAYIDFVSNNCYTDIELEPYRDAMRAALSKKSVKRCAVEMVRNGLNGLKKQYVVIDGDKDIIFATWNKIAVKVYEDCYNETCNMSMAEAAVVDWAIENDSQY